MAGRYPALDGVRGLAILVVLVHNLSVFRGQGRFVDRLWTVFVDAGWVGVQLFFVLSGFLITGILLDGGRQSSVRTFYARRALRIAPLYYVYLLVYFLASVRVEPSLARSFKEVVWYWLFLSNWSVLVYGLMPGLGHLWSLAVEEQFYLAWPWIVRRTSRSVFAWICVVIVVVSLAARVVFRVLVFDDMWSYSSTLTRMDALAIGALVALGLRSDLWRPRLLRWRRPVAAVSVLALLALMVWTHGLERFNALVQIFGYPLLAIAGAALVVSATQPTPPRLLMNRTLLFFGKYSYGIYVLHMPLKHIAFDRWERRLDTMLDARPVATDVLFVATLASVTVVLALLSWRMLEKPLLDLKDRWAPRG